MAIKTFAVELVNENNAPHVVITEAFTVDHARANTYKLHGMNIRIRSVTLSEMPAGSYRPCKGDVVSTDQGMGVVTDVIENYREALVRMDDGTFLDTTHGKWMPFICMARMGFDGDASVWRGQRVCTASDLY